jgi:hypothetical protein
MKYIWLNQINHGVAAYQGEEFFTKINIEHTLEIIKTQVNARIFKLKLRL